MNATANKHETSADTSPVWQCSECGRVSKNARAHQGHLRYGTKCRTAQIDRYRREAKARMSSAVSEPKR